MKQVCAKCGGAPVEWHHPLAYSGRQIVDWWATTFACKHHHEEATPHNNKYQLEIREFFERIVLEKYIGKLLVNYPKGNWLQHLKYLQMKNLKQFK